MTTTTSPPAATAPTATASAPSMLRAPLVGKRGVPADVRYRFESSVELNKATGLVVEVKPHIVVDKMSVEVKGSGGVRVDAAPVAAIQKALPSQIYRQNLSITPLAEGADAVQVMITMESPEGLAFGIYQIALKDTPAGKLPQKRPRE
jgi:hypothetical protein